MKHHIIKVQHKKHMHVVELGNAQSLSVVLVHGWTNNWYSMMPIAERMKNDFHIFIPDLMGYGHSDDLTHYSIEVQADYLAELLKKLQLGKVVLGGLSMGAFVVAECARKYPELVEKLILFGPVLRTPGEEKYHTIVEKVLGFAKKRNASIWLTKKIIERTAYMYAAAYFNCYEVNFPKLKKYGSEGRRLMRGQTFVDMGLSETTYDLLKTLKKTKCPTLMLLGSQYLMTNVQEAKKLVKKIETIECTIVPEAGHIVSLEQPERCVQVINDFFRKF